MSELSELESAYRTRDAIRRLALEVVLSEYPRPRYAVVTEIDLPQRIVTVQYPEDETATFKIQAGSMMPTEVGAIVRLAGSNGARYIDDVISGEVTVPGLEITEPTAWTTPAFQNGWGGFPTPTQTVQYRREGDLVRMRGLCRKLSSAAGNEILFTLPSGFRPPVNGGLLFGCWTSDGGASPIQAQRPVSINSNGQVTINVQLTGGTNWVSFDGVCFSTSA